MKDPAFLFYSADFLTGTMFMTDEQVGKYIRLLAAQHQNGGKLTENHMIFICKSHDEIIWSKFEKDETGNYFNVRLREETEKRLAYCKSRGDNKRGKIKEPKHKKIISKSYDNHMGDVNEDINRVKDKRLKREGESFVIDSLFEQIWSDWLTYRIAIKKPIKPVSEKLAYQELYKFSGGDPDKAKQIINQSIAKGWQGLFELKINNNQNGTNKNQQTPIVSSGKSGAQITEDARRKAGLIH